jgi:hypothetical protein
MLERGASCSLSLHFMSEPVHALLEAGGEPLTRKTRENTGKTCGNVPISIGRNPLMVRWSVLQSGHLGTNIA